MHVSTRILVLFCYLLSTLFDGTGASPAFTKRPNSIWKKEIPQSTIPDAVTPIPTLPNISKRAKIPENPNDPTLDVPDDAPKTDRLKNFENLAAEEGKRLKQAGEYIFVARFLNNEGELILNPTKDQEDQYSKDYLDKEQLKNNLGFTHTTLVIGQVGWNHYHKDFGFKTHTFIDLVWTEYREPKDFNYQFCPIDIVERDYAPPRNRKIEFVKFVRGISQEELSGLHAKLHKGFFDTHKQCFSTSAEDPVHCSVFVEWAIKELLKPSRPSDSSRANRGGNAR